MIDRKLCMAWYIWETCEKKSMLNLRNLPSLFKNNLVPQDTDEMIKATRIYEFNRYLKACCKTEIPSNHYACDERAVDFLTEIGRDDMLFVMMDNFDLDTKEWDKVYQKDMNIFRDWIKNNQQELLRKLNDIAFMEDWKKYATGNISSWEMKAMCFYHHKHELADVDNEKYGFVNFFELPEEPIIDRSFPKGGKIINLFKLSKICGTCIAKNKQKGLVTLLTPTGVVTVRFRKDYFSMFDKRISEKGADGVKHVIEKSWFDRGSMIVVQGMRSGDQFIAKKYASSGGHTLYKISEVFDNGEIVLQTERYQGGVESEQD